MNFAKGSTSKGRGTSFKGVLAYVLHDKDKAATTERVGFVHLCNLPPVDPDRAWQEMKATANAADHLKERHARAQAVAEGRDPDEAAKAARAGRKVQKPVYAFSLNWHRDDAPDAEHMQEKALEVLRLLGLEEHQAVITQHTDEPHPHVHIVVNLIHPDTGRVNTLANDEYKLDDWCAEYEIAAGIVRSPDRHTKFMEKLAKKAPRRHAEITAKLAPAKAAEKAPAEKRQRRPRNTQSRKEWEARKGASTDNGAKIEAAKIKRQTAEAFRQQRQREDAAERRRTAERNLAWKAYQKERAAIYEAFKPQLARVWDRPRRGELSAMQRVRGAWADPAKALREYQDRHEWKRFGRRQWRERQAFRRNENNVTGAIYNSLRLARVGAAERHTGRLSAAFSLIFDQARRQRLFDQQQDAAKKALRDRQTARKKKMSDPIHAARAAEIAKLAEAFQRKRDALDQRHTKEAAQEKTERAAIGLKADNAWQQWRGTFNIKARTRYVFNDQAGRTEVAKQPFNQAATMPPPESTAAKETPATKAPEAPALDAEAAAREQRRRDAFRDFGKGRDQSEGRGRERTRTPPKSSGPGQKQ